MKKYLYIITSVLSLTVIGCSDNDLVGDKPPFPLDKNEVLFGAGESVFTDNGKKDTRTIYEIGIDPQTQKPYTFDSYKSLRISWTNQDTVRVYSPQAPKGYQTADYRVAITGGDGKYDDQGFLIKLGGNGIHWAEGEQEQKFYAFYPGIDEYIKEGLKTKTTITAFLPTAQEKGQLVTWDSKTNQVKPDGSGDWKIISPDMHFCMMAATNTHKPGDKKDQISLNFVPFVTILDVLINGPATTETAYNILAVSIRSKSQDIVGKFSYDFITQQFSFPTEQQTDNKIATIDCMSGKKPLRLAPNEKLNLKFFLLPKSDIKASELTLYILLEGGRVMSLDLGKNLAPGQEVNLASGKITKVKTPKITLKNQTNNWMSLVHDDVYFASQLSLPGAKNAYTFKTLSENGVWNTNGSGDGMTGEDVTIQFRYPESYIMPFYQTKNIDDMFNSGVRAFDIKVITDGGTAKIFTAGRTMDITLVDFLNKLKSLIRGDQPDATEAAVVTINFAYSSDPNQKKWIGKIKEALQQYDPDGSTLYKVTSQTTMKDMRGKIGIMVNYSGEDDIPTKYIGIIKKFNTSVQNDEIIRLPLGGTGTFFLQNLQQVNNPEITNSGLDGVRPQTGLCPHYIMHDEYIGKVQSVDLIEKKKELVKDMFLLSQQNNASLNNLFCNDLSGFCVVNDNTSTGFRNYSKFYYGYLGWSPTGNKYNGVRDPKKRLPAGTKIEERPSNPKAGDTYFGEHGGEPEKGQGGNTVLFASKINPWAKDIVYDYVSHARTPMGIVFMNFTGVDFITIKDKKYEVDGVDITSLIMTNNFKFDLKKKPTTPTP